MRNCNVCAKKDVCGFYGDADLREIIRDLKDYLGSCTPIREPNKIISQSIDMIDKEMAESCIHFLELNKGDKK